MSDKEMIESDELPGPYDLEDETNARRKWLIQYIGDCQEKLKQPLTADERVQWQQKELSAHREYQRLR